MSTNFSGSCQTPTLAEIRAALEQAPARRYQRYELARARHNGAVGERHEAAVTRCLDALGLDPLRLPQDPASKHAYCPPGGKRPDVLIDVDGADCFVDVKFHRLGDGAYFALPEAELWRYDVFMGQFTGTSTVPLFFAVAAKQDTETLYLVLRQSLTVPGIVAGKSAMGVHLGICDIVYTIPRAWIAEEQARLLSGKRFKAEDFQPPAY